MSMVVVIEMSTGQQHHVDRNDRLDLVAAKVNKARGSGQLIEFRNNATPSRAFHIDPDKVVSISDDGYPY
jgi:hypothetical protein